MLDFPPLAFIDRDFLNMQLLGVVFAAMKSKNEKKIAERE